MRFSVHTERQVAQVCQAIKSRKSEGQKIIFKIDYFDESLTHYSPDSSDPSMTERAITIMLAEEY
jgi:hypothetical protein